MPYIKPELRPPIDRVVEELVDVCHTHGDMSYAIYRFLLARIKMEGASYEKIKGVISIGTETTQELRRRVLVPYEDEKMFENGDVE